MKLAIRLALLMSFSLVLGCSNAPPLFLGGTWVFTITPNNSPSAAVQATAVLTQLRNSIFGPVTFVDSSSSCSAGMMSGTINGDNLSLQLTQSQSTLKLTGAVTGGFPVTYSASGKYSATTGGCLQSSSAGTWSGFLSANTASSSAASTSGMQ